MNKRKDIRNFYVDDCFLIVYEKFKKVCERENISASEKIRELIEDYVHRHEPGNPQQTLPTMMQLGRAYHADTCFFCGGSQQYKAFIGKKTVYVCEQCVDSKRGWLSGWRRLGK